MNRQRGQFDSINRYYVELITRPFLNGVDRDFIDILYVNRYEADLWLLCQTNKWRHPSGT